MKRTFGTATGTVEIDGDERRVEVLYATEYRPATRTSPREESLVVEDAQFADGERHALDRGLIDRYYQRLFRIADKEARRPLSGFTPS